VRGQRRWVGRVRGEAVAQRMRRHALGDLGHVGGRMNGAVELAYGEMVERVLSGKQPDLGPRDPPPVAHGAEIRI
jgi:hypothetical protein